MKATVVLIVMLAVAATSVTGVSAGDITVSATINPSVISLGNEALLVVR